jgi:uncharacterized protein YdhG (YjbR/CyaY superfamily)
MSGESCQKGKIMETTNTPYKNIDEYIALFPKETQILLKKMRAVIREVSPAAEEAIKYQMPTFVLKGINLVHFAAFKNHVGFYPVPTGIEKFKKELSAYKTSKGAVQFPLDKPLPLDLIRKVVKFRVAENIKKAEEKARKKK